MKTIEEKAKEYLNSQLTKVDKETVNGLTLYYFQAATFDGYIKGHEDGKSEANAEWQEKVRWIPVEERFPEYYHVVLLKTESYTFMGWRASNGEESFYTIYCSDTIMHQNVTHWREII